MPTPIVACPTCHADVEWSGGSPWRPFCCARCKAIDLGDWASDRFVIPGDAQCDSEGAPLSTSEPRRD